MKNFARRWLLPPGINHALTEAPRSVKRLWGWQPPGARSGGARLSYEGKKAATLEDLRVVGVGEMLWLEATKLRTWGRAYTREQHQHVRYFSDGFGSLRRFYETHQPENQMEMHMVAEADGFNFSPVKYPKIRKPWTFESRFRQDGPWGLEHGVQFHGPVSEKKLVYEKRRLDDIRTSVERFGFQKFDSDFILFGELLINDCGPEEEDFRVCVENGHHRISLLSHLGWPLIPVEPAWWWLIREVRLSDLPRWPGILDRTFSEEAAKAYFLSYFRSPTEKLLAGW